MSRYQGTADRQERAKALAGVLVVHVVLAAVILSGLDVRTIQHTVERLKTFDLPQDLPPPVPEPPPPPPRPDRSGAPKDEAAPANIKSKPTPVAAPTPAIPLPVEPRINTSEVRGPEGVDRTAGASSRPGAGTGAGGQGAGFGGGGSGGTGTGAGSGRGFTPASRISKIPDREYRRFVQASGMRRGSVGITVKVNVDGAPSQCRVIRSSGNPTVDALMCQLTLSYVRFRPARDPQGRAVAQDISWFPDWAPN